MNTVTNKRWASVYSNDRLICMQTHSGLRVSAFDPAGLQLIYDSNESPEMLGKGLLQALAASRVLNLDEARQFFESSSMKQRYENWVTRLLQHVGSGDRIKLFEKNEALLSCMRKRFDLYSTHDT